MKGGIGNMQSVDLDNSKRLEKEGNKIRKKIDAIFDDFKMDESKKDLWEQINLLVDNEIEQEKYCNQ